MSVTIKQIAEEAGISWPAVSQILKARGRFADATRERVLAVAKKHGYRPNASARALRGQQSRLIGLVLRNAPDHAMTNMVAFEYLLGINQQFQDADYASVIVRAGELIKADDVEPRIFRERMVDGVIVVSSLPTSMCVRVSGLSPKTIWLDSRMWDETCCVRRDEEAAGRMAVEAMVNLGYREIVYLGRDGERSDHYSHTDRERGARMAAAEAGVKLDVTVWAEGAPNEEFTQATALISRGAGIVVGTMPVARRLAHAAMSMGFVPGHHYGLICCDDSYETRIYWPGLTRISFDRYAMGGIAANMMLQLLASPSNPPESVRVRGELVVGNTAWGPDFPRV